MSRQKGFKMSKAHKEAIGRAHLGKPGTNLGRKFPEEWKQKIRESEKGKIGLRKEKNPNWKGGFKISGNRVLKRVARGTYHSYARIQMERKLRRSLSRKECVHHLDGDWRNNSLRNLMLFPSHSEHIKFEQRLNTFAKQLLYGQLAPDLKSKLKYLYKRVK